MLSMQTNINTKIPLISAASESNITMYLYSFYPPTSMPEFTLLHTTSTKY